MKPPRRSKPDVRRDAAGFWWFRAPGGGDCGPFETVADADRAYGRAYIEAAGVPAEAATILLDIRQELRADVLDQLEEAAAGHELAERGLLPARGAR